MGKYAVGVDIGGTTIKMALVSENGQVADQTAIPTQGEDGPVITVNRIAQQIEKFKQSLKPGDHLLGTGIGVPGVVDLDGGTLRYPPNLKGWEIVRLGDLMLGATKISCKVENDANVAAFGEGKFGAGKNYKSFVMVTLGTGVGGGIVLDGKIYRGVYGGAGEIGHVSINMDGPQCNCGNYGCIERYIGQKNIVEYAKNQLSRYPNSPLFGKEDQLEVKHLSEFAAKGDSFSIDVLNYVGRMLGASLVSVMHVLDVRVFVIGGGVAGAGHHIFDPALEYVSTHCLGGMKDHISIVPATLGNDAGVLGAAALVF